MFSFVTWPLLPGRRAAAMVEEPPLQQQPQPLRLPCGACLLVSTNFVVAFPEFFVVALAWHWSIAWLRGRLHATGGAAGWVSQMSRQADWGSSH
eukprot:scaffold1603_cov45-Attheya_sp.AAC.3